MLRISSCLVAVSLAVVCGVRHVPGAPAPSGEPQPVATTSRPVASMLPLAESSQPSPVLMAQARRALAESPIRFEKNEGQSDPAVRWIGRGLGYSLWVTDTEAVVQLTRRDAKPKPKPDRPGMSMASLRPEAPKPEEEKVETAVIRLKFAGANPHPEVVGEAQSAVVTNVYRGNDRSKWRENVPSFGKARLRGLYPGIDLVFYGNERELEFDWEVAPGADPSQIGLKVEGALPSLGSDGALRLATPTGEVEVRKPIAYQQSLDRPVEAAFALSGSTVRLALGPYDPSLPLTIDPVLLSSSYLGGSRDEEPGALTPDGTGGVWVAGTTSSSDFPTARAFQQSRLEGMDASMLSDSFVARLTAGGRLASASYLGGSGADYLQQAASDGTGGIWVVGITSSADFPTARAFQGTLAGQSDCFVTRVGAAGFMQNSSLFGGSAADRVNAVTCDRRGGLWLVGDASSNDMPMARPLQPFRGGPSDNGANSDAFVARIDASGQLSFSTYFGGSNDDSADCIVASGAATVWVSGETFSSDFPLKEPAWRHMRDPEPRHILDAKLRGFVAQFTAGALSSSSYSLGGGLFRSCAEDGVGGVWILTDNKLEQEPDDRSDVVLEHFGDSGSLTHSTVAVGGSRGDDPYQCVHDGAGGVWVVGVTQSSDFCRDRPKVEPQDREVAFCVRINAKGVLTYSRLLGPVSSTLFDDVVPDGNGGIWFCYDGYVDDSPTHRSQQGRSGGRDVALICIAGDGTLAQARYLGGSRDDGATSLAPDGTGGVWIVGYTESGDFPAVAAFQASKGGGVDLFLAHFGEPDTAMAEKE